MTMEQLHTLLEARFPDQTVCVTASGWRNVHRYPEGNEVASRVDWRVSIFRKESANPTKYEEPHIEHELSGKSAQEIADKVDALAGRRETPFAAVG